MDGFTYRYSAAEREEAERIRRKYAGGAAAESPLDELRRLDRAASRPAKAWGIVVGVLGVLVMGAGMSMVMVGGLLAPGIAVGAAGIVLAACAYPVSRRVGARSRERNAARIMELTDKLLEAR